MSSSKYFNSYCVLIIWILALAGSGSACSGGDEDKYRIVRKTDEGDKQLVVATEETAKMYCRTNVPWKKCWWKPPRNGVRQVSKRIFAVKSINYENFRENDFTEVSC